ncbi:hypothetical protein AB6A40_007908 [Gnathostoma spinigerum]|uniref:Uncharacterized protein n=1 Tax=Gnathostoma spinigerum TaxID=75299 RepID=A0ABD6EVB7_9BILA
MSMEKEALIRNHQFIVTDDGLPAHRMVYEISSAYEGYNQRVLSCLSDNLEWEAVGNLNANCVVQATKKMRRGIKAKRYLNVGTLHDTFIRWEPIGYHYGLRMKGTTNRIFFEIDDEKYREDWERTPKRNLFVPCQEKIVS